MLYLTRHGDPAESGMSGLQGFRATRGRRSRTLDAQEIERFSFLEPENKLE